MHCKSDAYNQIIMNTHVSRLKHIFRTYDPWNTFQIRQFALPDYLDHCFQDLELLDICVISAKDEIVLIARRGGISLPSAGPIETPMPISLHMHVFKKRLALLM